LPPLEIITSDLPIAVRINQEIARQWRNFLEIRVAEIIVPSDEFRQRWLNNPPHIWNLGWTADYLDPYNFLNDANWRPIGGWRHETYDNLILEAKRCSDREERFALYAQAE
jgi:ABC-type oligopeptide transport system substrate-binding subunit